MKNFYLSSVSLILIIFLGFELTPADADNTNGISIQNITVQPSMVKVGNTLTVSATLVNNSTVPIVLDGGTCVPIIEHVPFFTTIFDNHTKIKAKNLTCAGVGLSKILDPGNTLIGTSPDSTVTYIATESGTANVTVTFQYHVKNQDLTQPNIEQTISKSFQFLIHDINETSAQKPPAHVSPLKQFKSGVNAEVVKCKSDYFVLIIKTEDNSPACVKKDAVYRLSTLGWGYLRSSTTKVDLLDSKIVGGTINEFQYELNSASIIIKIQASSNGNLTVTIPKIITDLHPNRHMFENYAYITVLVDGVEQNINIISTANGPSFTIPFTNGTQEIELIGKQTG